MVKLSELINLEHYKVFQYFMVGYNNTSGLSLLDCEKINLVSLDEDHLSLTLPRSSCSVGHSLTFYLSKNKKSVKVKKLTPNQSLPNTVTITVKVNSMGLTEDPLIVGIETSLTNYTKKEWKEIIVEYTQRQEELIKIFNEISGKNHGTKN